MAEERIPVAIAAATRYELGAVVPLLSGRAVRRSGPFDYQVGSLEGVEVAAARTGIGLEHAAARIEEFFRAVRPRVLIATGFAGGLDPESATGDLVLAEEIWDFADPAAAGASPGASRAWSADPALLAAAVRAGSAEGPGAPDAPERGRPIRVRSGRLLTSPRVVARAEEKRGLGERLRALAVDMESSALARACAARGIALVALRAVFDPAALDVPEEAALWFRPDGRLSARKVLGATVRHPFRTLAAASLGGLAAAALASLRWYIPRLVRALAREGLLG